MTDGRQGGWSGQPAWRGLLRGAGRGALPADVMRDGHTGVVIAHDVSPTRELHVDPALDVAPNGAVALWRQVRRRGAAVPTVGAIMARTAVAGSVRNSHEVRKAADLYVHPPVEGFGIFEWRSLERLIEIGYEHGGRAIAAWHGRR